MAKKSRYGGLIGLLAVWLSAVSSTSDIHETAGVPRGRQLFQASATYTITDAADLVAKLQTAQSAGVQQAVFSLPSAVLSLDATLSINISVTLQGASVLGGSPATVIRCSPGAFSGNSLLEFSGQQLVIADVQLSDCPVTGLNLLSRGADVTIERSMFTNFNLSTAPVFSFKANSATPPAPSPLDLSRPIAAAVHSSSFSGNLTVRNTLFTGNGFYSPPPPPPPSPPPPKPPSPPAPSPPSPAPPAPDAPATATGRRLLNEDAGDSFWSEPAEEDVYMGGGNLAEVLAASPVLRQRRLQRRMAAAGILMESVLQEDLGMLAGTALGSMYGLTGRRQLQANTRYTMPLLEEAKNLHRSYEAGPWKDDFMAAIAVVCARGTGASSCNLRLEGVTISNNTGMATSGLAVMCDGADSCDVALTNCTVTANKLLWTPAVDPRTVNPNGANSILNPIVEEDYYGEYTETAGTILFRRMAPWLTYTYPLVDVYATDPSDVVLNSVFIDGSKFPKTTGRTLGAVVLMQRNSPSPGVRPSAPAMMRVNVTGGLYMANEGSAIMSTAADFMDMAGGNGTWGGGAPRHSVDVTMSGATFTNHTSGWPAVWMRWPRKVTVSNCTVTRSTGAMWFDEVRDSAVVRSSTFTSNAPNQLWLDYWNFAQLSLPAERYIFGTHTGAGQWQTVKIQMTALGAVANTAVVSDCTFDDNPSYLSGVLHMRAFESVVIDKDDQPSKAAMTIANTGFSNTRCRKAPSACTTFERPLYVFNVYNAALTNCKFTTNGNGGVYFSKSYGASITSSTFDRNVLTFVTVEDPDIDNVFGGAAVAVKFVGKGGVNVTGSTFTNNVATLGGGAIFSRQFAYLQVTGSTFENNTAQQYEGGAIWMTSSDTIDNDLNSLFIISGSNFTRNSAGRNGGAIYAYTVAPGRAWSVSNSRFTDNVAMLNPLDRGEAVLDRCGGGAIMSYVGEMVVVNSYFARNKVLGHAGGAIRVTDSTRIIISHTVFESNVAIMGGALAYTRLASNNPLTNCTFNNNTVVDPWAWPETSPVKALATRTFPSISVISAGFGGAIASQAAVVSLVSVSSFTGCSAKFGGAVAITRSGSFTIMSDTTADFGVSTLTVADNLAAAANSTGPVLPYKHLFANNSALIGGALYVATTDEVTFYTSMLQTVSFPGQRNATLIAAGFQFFTYLSSRRISYYYPPLSVRYQFTPGILMYGNTASGGGALYLEGNGKVDIKNVRFAGNAALPQPLATNYSGLYGLEAYNGTAVGQDCFGGGGGAVCVVGLVAKEVKIYNSDVLYNTAMDGGGMFISEGQNCAVQSGCYKVTLDAIDMRGNVALGRGGAIHWVHDNVLRITSCPRDVARTMSTNGTALFPNPVRFYNTSANETAPPVPYNITLLVPDRKGPAEWYGQLPAAHRAALLASVGGAVNTTSGAVYASSGRIQLAAGAVFALSTAANTTRMTEKGTLMAVAGTLLNGNGLVQRLPNTNGSSNGTSSFNSSAVSNGTLALLDAPAPLVLNRMLVNDTDWLGIPYQNLPCGSWSNTADAGNDISTSAYVLMNPPRIDFYTSNTDIDLSVTVHDWFAQNCTGDSSTRAVIIVSAVSPDISGETSIPPVNGTAHFTAMRLRAREGLHNVTLAGRLNGPTRELLSDMVSIYVRPCGINEFLAPKNLDECIPCDTGNYNFNVSAVSCGTCPDNADCRYPDSRCVTNGNEDCDVIGFMVPEDGYWHSSFFSEQVIECPNPDSCTSENRSNVLAAMQQRIFHLARSIQLNTSTAVADEAAKWVNESLVYNNLRRLLQVKAINDTNYTAVLINITKDLLPDYLQNQCAEGYTGTLCGECAIGYGWSQVATCVHCSSKALNDLYYALVTLLTLSLLAFTVYSSLREQKRQGLLVGGMAGKGRKSGDNTSPVHSAPISPADTQYQQQVAAAAATAAAAAASAAAAGTAPASTVPQHAGDSFHGVAMILDPAAPGDARQVQQQMSPLQAPAQLPPLQLPAQKPLQAPPQLPPLQAPANMPLVSPDVSQYEDPAVSAARGRFPSAPGTPRSPAVHAPYPTFDAPPNFEARSGGSVIGAPQDVPSAAAAALLNGGSPMGCPPGTTNGGVGSSLNAGNGNGGARPVAEGMEEVSDFEATPKHTSDLDVRSGSVHAAPPPLALPHEPHHLPAGVMMQAVPVMHGTPPHSPPLVQPHSPRHYDPTHGPSSPGYADRPSHGRTQSGERPSNQSNIGARRRAHQSTVVKIFVSYIQVLALLQNVPLDIPGVMDTYYRINNQATSYPGILVSLDCSIPDGGSVSKAFIRVILAVLAPLYIFAGAVIFFLLFAVFDYYVLTPYLAKKVNKRGKRKHALQLPTLSMHISEYVPRQLIVTFITIMFFFYPNVVQSIMTIFSCVDVDTYTGNELATGLGLQTNPVWSQDFGQVCYEGAHLGLALGLGVPAVILIAVGWPLVSALLVAGKMGCLTHIRFTEDMTEMFLADFKAKYVWWESVVMLRKFAIAMIVTFVDDGASAGVQLLLVICVLVIAVALHLVSMPYHHLYTNNLELVSLVVLLATLYFSLYFSLSASLTEGGRVAISVIILVINILMVLTFVYYIIQAYWYAALYNSGIAEIDKESREKLTADEIKKRIMARQMIEPPPSPKPGGASGSPADAKSRSLKLGVQHRMASLYASAVVAGLRVGSTTNKVVQRMKTMLDPQPPSRLASLNLDPEAAADSSGDTHSAPLEVRGAKSTRDSARHGAGSAPAAFEALPHGEPREPTVSGLNSADLAAMQASLAARRRGPGSTAAGSGANTQASTPLAGSTPMSQGSPTPSELMGTRGGATHSSVTHGRSRLAVATSGSIVSAQQPVPGSQPTTAAGDAP